MTKRRLPYQRGRDAANGVGEYDGAVTVPHCPYDTGTPEEMLWRYGFSDAVSEQAHWSVMA